MDVRELRRRESLDDITCTTLTGHFSRVLGAQITVGMGAPPPNGQAWLEHHLFGAYMVRGATREARRFLVDLYRYTPSRARFVPQAVAATLAGTRVGSRLASRARLWCSSPIPHAESIVILPGNQRMRILDFADRTTIVVQKAGFERKTLAREYAARTAVDTPFLPVLRADVEAGWLEEVLVDAWALPRCPPWRSQETAAHAAFALLRKWSESQQRTLSTLDYSSALLTRTEKAGAMVDERLNSRLGARALELAVGLRSGIGDADTVTLDRSHGDFQPGNVLVPKDGSAPVIIDLEHAGERSNAYDLLTWHLRSRSARGFAERAGTFLDGAPLPAWAAERDLGRARSRRLALVVFALEDLVWYLEESLTGPFHTPSDGLRLLVDELERLELHRGAWWIGP